MTHILCCKNGYHLPLYHQSQIFAKVGIACGLGHNMTSAFQRRGRDPEPEVSAAEVGKLLSKIGRLVAERDFWADASRQLLGTRGKKW